MGGEEGSKQGAIIHLPSTYHDKENVLLLA